MFRAWIIWLLSALFMCFKNAIEVSPSIMAPDLMREFSLSGAQMGNFAAFYFYAYLILQIPAGLLIDKWGPRRVATIAIAVCSLGIYLFSNAETFRAACAGRFLTGLGAAFAAVNSIKLIANWFPVGKFAFMMGLMMTVGMLGAVGGQAPLSAFIAYLGWRSAMQVLALSGLVLMAIFFLVVKDRAPHHKQVDVILEKPSVARSLKAIFKNRESWYLSFYSGFAFTPVMTFGGLWGVSFLTEAFGFSQHTAAIGTSLIFLGFAAGAPIFGWLSDRIGQRKPVMFWGTLASAFLLAFVVYFPIKPLVMPALFAFGFMISAFLLCFSMIKEKHAILLAGTSFGFMNAFNALFGAFSDPLTGKFLDLWWTGTLADGARVFSVGAYQYALCLLMAYFVLALILLKPIRETFCKQAGR